MVRRNRDDWTEIALRALADGGLGAVAIEPLAASAGATKGSVYHHFPNREALLKATVERWEREHTEKVIELVEAEKSPRDKLRTLFATVLDRTRKGSVEMALQAGAENEVIAPVLQRVTKKRIDYLTELFEQLGFEHGHAKKRALIAFSLYLGQVQMWATVPGLVEPVLDEAVQVLTAR
ncbi:TetR/AcrR family transcriptional regulator [Lentzea sp. BCCO 10_0856]|uniref:TetR/AcrR family transcriptional regulator n=1 Tax=Lentzea miocenica TaxID=3095431 RepID=A0ABU4T8C3_9PSEU|nr:TetR/AcrR family transcriptional regulator [Lentzea sp. BCCO 10_0856]MDX8034414.1 TetR/AcrR family transcriptional regulator [Lentzea sp. BCCO 10_0856]